jgi:glyoxylase-like metal-dependent hydrolase (beta-lactamase superfamily II)
MRAMRSVTESIHQRDELLGGPTLLAGATELVLVDTGLPGSEVAIFSLVDSLGRNRAELRHILVTHADPDHIGGLPALVEATDAQVYAQALEAEVIEGKRPGRGGEVVETPVSVARIVSEGEVLPLSGGIRVVESFGHTAGHVSYLLADGNVLLAGDALNNLEGLAGSPPEYTLDAGQARDAVRKLAALDPDTICFGHGPPIVGGAAERLRALAETV